MFLLITLALLVLSTSFGRNDDVGLSYKLANSCTVHIAINVARRRLSFGKFPEYKRRFSDIPSRMNDCRDTADIRISRDCGRESTSRFFFMCTFGVMRWTESEWERKREKEKSIVIKEFTLRTLPGRSRPVLLHRTLFPAPSFCNRDRYIPEIFLHFKRYIWIEGVADFS